MDIETAWPGVSRVENTRGGVMREPDQVAAMLRLHRLGWGSRRIALTICPFIQANFRAKRKVEDRPGAAEDPAPGNQSWSGGQADRPMPILTGINLAVVNFSLTIPCHNPAPGAPQTVARMPSCPEPRDPTMTETEYNRKLDELDRLINDPEVPMQPHRIWELLAEVADRGPMPDAATHATGMGRHA